MKLLIFITLFAPLTVMAQFTTGDKFIGGTMDLSTQRAPGSPNGSYASKSASFSLQPQLGYFLNERLAIGGMLGYTTSNQEFKEPSGITKLSGNDYSVGFFARRYFEITNNFFFALNVNLHYSQGVNNYTTPNSTSKSKFYAVEVGARPMFIFFPSEQWGIEAGIGNLTFNHSKYITSDQQVNKFDLNYGSISLGLSYYLRKGD